MFAFAPETDVGALPEITHFPTSYGRIRPEVALCRHRTRFHRKAMAATVSVNVERTQPLARLEVVTELYVPDSGIVIVFNK
jgi:hypothetical protein